MVRAQLYLVISAIFAVLLPELGLPQSSPKTYNVQIKGFEFVPNKLEVHAGDTVVWQNQDIVPHIVSADKFTSRNLDTGQSWTYKSKVKGDFHYICRYHPTMKAELIVR